MTNKIAVFDRLETLRSFTCTRFPAITPDRQCFDINAESLVLLAKRPAVRSAERHDRSPDFKVYTLLQYSVLLAVRYCGRFVHTRLVRKVFFLYPRGQGKYFTSVSCFRTFCKSERGMKIIYIFFLLLPYRPKRPVVSKFFIYSDPLRHPFPLARFSPYLTFVGEFFLLVTFLLGF